MARSGTESEILTKLPAQEQRGKAARAGIYYRTVRHTCWSQLLWRMRYSLERRRKLSPRTISRWRWPEARNPRIRTDFPDVPLIATRAGSDASLLAPRAGECPDWRLGPITKDRLRTITLHYHAWAYELADAAAGNDPKAEEATTLFRDYVSDWIARCALETAGARDLAWNAYAIATRLTWWIRCHQRSAHAGAIGASSSTIFLPAFGNKPAICAIIWNGIFAP